MVQSQQADQIWLYFIGRCFEMDLESRLHLLYHLSVLVSVFCRIVIFVASC